MSIFPDLNRLVRATELRDLRWENQVLGRLVDAMTEAKLAEIGRQESGTAQTETKKL